MHRLPRAWELDAWRYDEAGIFDGVVQAVGHHRILPVDERRQPVVLPQQMPGIALPQEAGAQSAARY